MVWGGREVCGLGFEDGHETAWVGLVAAGCDEMGPGQVGWAMMGWVGKGGVECVRGQSRQQLGRDRISPADARAPHE